MPAASVIIPAYNAAQTLGRLLDALAAQRGVDAFEVIVVDDGSTDDTIAIAETAAIPVKVLRQQQRGPAAARNLGVEHASSGVLAFTDADCVPVAGWLAAGMAALETADLVQGAVHADSGAVRLPFDRTVWVTRESGLYECASLFLRRELFAVIGGFEDVLEARLGKQLAEDTWFGWRARREGARTAFCADALVEHAVFRRGPGAYVGERRRLMYFPAIARRIPELRDEFLWKRYFLNARTAAFDLGLAGAVGSALAGSPWPLLLAAPYLVRWGRDALIWRRRAPVAALVDLAADSLGCAALIVGTARSRTVVL